MDRADDLSRARTLSIASVVWGTIAAVAGIVLGVTSRSLSLLGFGGDSAIDAIASVALVWRFQVEVRDPHRAERIEHVADQVVGAVLVVAAISLVLGAARALLAHQATEFGSEQLALLVLSLVILPPLALAKRRVANRLGSNALRNDALLTAAAALLAMVALVVGLLATFGLWWADAAGSLLIAAILAREGWSTVRLART